MELPAVVAAYLLGSISFPWLVARARGVDLRTVGSRKLGGSNLAAVLGVRAGLLGGGLDALKGAVAVLGARLLGLPEEFVALCAVAAVAGQAWPVFHDFDGGRANATGWGALLALDPLAAAIAAVPLALVSGFRLRGGEQRRIVPVVALLTFVIWPALVIARAGLTAPAGAGIAIFGAVLLRRLTAGVRGDLATGAPAWRVLLDRALYDRSELQKRGLLPL